MGRAESANHRVGLAGFQRPPAIDPPAERQPAQGHHQRDDQRNPRPGQGLKGVGHQPPLIQLFHQVVVLRPGVVVEEVIEDAVRAQEAVGDAAPADGDGEQRQQHQRYGHERRAFVGVFGQLGARFAQEGHADLARRVEGSQQRGHGQGDKDNQGQQLGVVGPLVPRFGEDLVLRPEAGGDKREAGQGQAADEERPEGDGHLVAQAAHVAHVLRVVVVVVDVHRAVLHAVDD